MPRLFSMKRKNQTLRTLCPLNIINRFFSLIVEMKGITCTVRSVRKRCFFFSLKQKNLQLNYEKNKIMHKC